MLRQPFRTGVDPSGWCGVRLEEDRAGEMDRRLEKTMREAAGAVELMWNHATVLGRFEGTGTLTSETAAALGMVGPAARATGLFHDVRKDHPYSIFRFTHIPVSTWDTGDVFARAYVRWLEMQRSSQFLRNQLRSLPRGNSPSSRSRRGEGTSWFP